MTPLILLTLLVVPSLGARLPYIIGGADVEPIGKYPWQGSLQVLGSHSCGCSLVTADWVVTAAHCILSVRLQSVVLGMHHLEDTTQGDPATYEILEAIKHPDYDGNADGFPNDIAMIQLVTSAELNGFVGTIELAPSVATNAGFSECVISGWGATRSGLFPGGYPNILQEGAVDTYTTEECRDRFVGVSGATINEGHICVGEPGVRGACSGDSGGPLVCTYEGRQVLAGLTSWGLSTCNPAYPSVYTRISYFRDWIEQTIG